MGFFKELNVFVYENNDVTTTFSRPTYLGLIEILKILNANSHPLNNVYDSSFFETEGPYEKTIALENKESSEGRQHPDQYQLQFSGL